MSLLHQPSDPSLPSNPDRPSLPQLEPLVPDNFDGALLSAINMSEQSMDLNAAAPALKDEIARVIEERPAWKDGYLIVVQKGGQMISTYDVLGVTRQQAREGALAVRDAGVLDQYIQTMRQKGDPFCTPERAGAHLAFGRMLGHYSDEDLKAKGIDPDALPEALG